MLQYILGTSKKLKFGKNQELSKIKKGHFPGKSIEKISNFQENHHGDFTKESCSYHNTSLYSPTSPSMALQEAKNSRSAQRRR
jgi:hypothetical protein